MVTRVFESVIHATPEAVRDFHNDVKALTLLTPPDQTVEIIGDTTAVKDGALHVLRIKMWNRIPVIWKARISNVSESGFTDTAEKGPFAVWRHKHEWLPHPEGTLLRDTVTYSAPGGPFAAIAHALFVNKNVAAMFAHRHAVTKRELEKPTP